MKMSGQLHPSTALPPWKEPPVSKRRREYCVNINRLDTWFVIILLNDTVSTAKFI